MHQEDRDFWSWQHRALGWLLGWGAASVVFGAGLATARRSDLRQIGLQAIGWGGIDAALAIGGRRDARHKQSAISAQRSVDQEAARFQRIVAINAGLDLLYIAGGLRLALTARRDSSRYGTGVGIAIQGLFLLIYDSLLTWLLARQRDRRRSA
jgi:hypothetical protein